MGGRDQSAGDFEAAFAGIESRLGDPLDPGNPFSFAQLVASDESDGFSAEQERAIDALGLYPLFIPRRQGGVFVSLDQLFGTLRGLARRDLSLALQVSFRVWTHLAWIAGTEDDQALVRGHLAQGYDFALGVSEREHGADVLANAVVARGGDPVRLYGAKWPIGNHARARGIFVLARAEDKRGPRAFSWYYVDAEAAARSIRRTPNVPKAGMRAASLGGIELDGAPARRIGGEGQGFEALLRLFQVTRFLVSSFCLGSTDTCLRLAADFALERQLYGQAVADIPSARNELVRAFALHFACDLYQGYAARVIQRHPEHLGLVSLVAKYLLPRLTAGALESARTVFGARAFLREGRGSGIFQKMGRDHQIVGLFDGASPVCLHSLYAMLPYLLNRRGEMPTDRGGPSQDFEYAALSLVPKAGDPLALVTSEEVEALLGGIDLTESLGCAVRDTFGAHRASIEACRAAQGRHVDPKSETALALAARYAEMHLVSALLRAAAEEPRLPPVWLAAMVVLCGSGHRVLDEVFTGAELGRLFSDVETMTRRRRLYSLIHDCQTADAGPPAYE